MNHEEYLILKNTDPEALAKEVTRYLNLNQGWATRGSHSLFALKRFNEKVQQAEISYMFYQVIER